MRSRFLKYLNKQCEHLGIHKIETETNLPVPVNLTLYRVPPQKNPVNFQTLHYSPTIWGGVKN